jgi:hypothetical protein
VNSLEFDVFGRPVLVEATGTGWAVFYLGNEGKRRPAHDLRVPDFVAEADLAQYLADVCHEWATPGHPDVRPLP